jgi:anti-anti-sigma factor
MTLLMIERVEGVIVARPGQDVDAAVVVPMRDELAASIGSEVSGVVLDLSSTRYVDSAGLDMIFRLAERLATGRSVLVLVIPERSQLARLAAIVGLPQAMAVVGTIEGALERVHAALGTQPPGDVAPPGASTRAAPPK